MKGIHSGTVQRRNCTHTKYHTLRKILHHNVFNSTGCTEEQRSGDLIYPDLFGQFLQMFINHLRIIIHIDPAIHMSLVAHPFNEKQTCQNHADLNCYDEVKYNRQHKGNYQHDNIALWSCLHQMFEGSPLAHIISYDKQDGCNGRHWDHTCIRHQHYQYDYQRNRMDHTCNWCTAAIFNVSRCTCNSACSRDAAK